jgi:hypothetical protein
MNSSFRALTSYEHSILERLLSAAFPGRDQLRNQLKVATAKSTNVDGVLFLQCDPILSANVKSRIPTEGQCADVDGIMIHMLLHVVDGTMKELETYKDDGSKVRNLPIASDLVLFTPYGDEGVKWREGEPEADGDSSQSGAYSSDPAS